MALSDFGYAPELLANRLLNVFEGSGRLNAALVVVDTEFNAEFPIVEFPGLVTPEVNRFSLVKMDDNQGAGQAQMFVVSTSFTPDSTQNQWNEQPLDRTRGTAVLGMVSEGLLKTQTLLRRYAAGMAKVIYGNRSLNPDSDGFVGIVGIGRPTFELGIIQLTSGLHRGIVTMTVQATVQTYGNT